MKKAIFTFGRFNPPTAGHQKLVEKVRQIASSENADYWIFPSWSQNATKDPLPHKLKVEYMKKAFPMCAKYIISDRNAITAPHALTILHNKGYTDVSMVVGSDRISEFDSLLNKYNDVKSKHGYYNFDSISVLSAGERDPDSQDVEGMSASKLRQAVKDEDESVFLSGLPDALSKQDGLRLYKDLHKHMNESYTENSLEFVKYLQNLTPGETVGTIKGFKIYRRKKKRKKSMKKESIQSFSQYIDENINNPKEYLTPDFSEIKDPRVLKSARQMVKQAKADGGIVFHMSGEGYSVQYAQDKNSIEWPGDDALEDGFIKVVYAKDFF